MLLMIILVLLLSGVSDAFPPPGIWVEEVNQDNQFAGFATLVDNESSIQVCIRCNPADRYPQVETKVKMSWVIRRSPCYKEYIGAENNQIKLKTWFRTPGLDILKYGYEKPSLEEIVICEKNKFITLKGDRDDRVVKVIDSRSQGRQFCWRQLQESMIKWFHSHLQASEMNKKESIQAEPSFKPVTEGGGQPQQPESRRRPTGGGKTTSHPSPPTVLIRSRKKKGIRKGEDVKAPVKLTEDSKQFSKNVIAKIAEDGAYLLIIKIEPVDMESDFSVTVKVEIKTPFGYLSNEDRNILLFYGTMWIIYVIYGIVWLRNLAYNWSDVMEVQVWIGAVICLGVAENASFFVAYAYVNTTGIQAGKVGIGLAVLVSCLRRTIARLAVLIIVTHHHFYTAKPRSRVGMKLHRVFVIGALYFLLFSIVDCLRHVSGIDSDSDPNGTLIKPLVVALVVFDIALCWWVFTSLAWITRMLKLHENIVKLSLRYNRIFTKTLVFGLLAFIVYMVWSMIQHRLNTCITDWTNLWIDGHGAFWPVVVSVILLVTMILWRPGVNNQRLKEQHMYVTASDKPVFPLMPSAQDDDNSAVNDAFEDIEMSNKNPSTVTDNKSENQEEEQ